MSDMSSKKITKTQARYLARAVQQVTKPQSQELVEDTSASNEVVSIAPLLGPEVESMDISESTQKEAQRTEVDVPEVEISEEEKMSEIPVHILETTPPTPVLIKKVSSTKRARPLIEGEQASYFIDSLKRERAELIDALCAAGFNHNRFALGNDGYAEEVRHEVHLALRLGEWSVGSIMPRKEYGFRSWKDIAEEVALISVIQKDVLTDTLFDAIIREVVLYPSAGTKEMIRRGLIHVLVLRQMPTEMSASLSDLLSEVMRVYFTIQKGALFSPYEYALIAAVYAYYGDTPPNTVSHEVVHSGGWTGLKKTLLKGGGVSTVDQFIHSPKSDRYPLPDIATLPRTYS